MNTQVLNAVIQKLKESNSEEHAYLGFFQYGGGPDESKIKANKEGLSLYAVALLEASIEIDNREFKNEKEELFYISTDWISDSSEFYFSSIELFKNSCTEIEPITEYNETWKDQLTKYCFIGIIIFLLISILIGAITIIGWFF